MNHKVEFFFRTDDGQMIPVTVTAPAAAFVSLPKEPNAKDLHWWLGVLVTDCELEYVRGPLEVGPVEVPE